MNAIIRVAFVLCLVALVLSDKRGIKGLFSCMKKCNEIFPLDNQPKLQELRNVWPHYNCLSKCTGKKKNFHRLNKNSESDFGPFYVPSDDDVQAVKADDVQAVRADDVQAVRADDVQAVRADDDENRFLDAGKAWDAYRSELLKFFKQGGSSSLSGMQIVMGGGIDAEWENDDNIFQTLANSYSGYGGRWGLNAGETFSQRYNDFVNHIKIPSIKNKRYHDIMNKFYDQEDELLYKQDDEIGKCYEKFERQKSFKDFQSFGRTYCYKMNYYERKIQQNQGQLAYYGRAAYGDDKAYMGRKALTKFATSWKKKFIEITTLKSFINNCKAGRFNPFRVSLNRHSHFNQQEQKWSSFSLTVGIPNVFTLGVGSSKQKMKATTRLEDMKMEITAQSFGAIRFTPDPSWFTGDVLRSYRSGPFTKNKRWFGKGGRLAVLPRTFYVVYKPTISLYLNKQDSDFMAKSSSFNLGISIYGFTFNFGKSSSVQKEKVSDKAFKFTFRGNSETPQIVAVDNHILPS